LLLYTLHLRLDPLGLVLRRIRCCHFCSTLCTSGLSRRWRGIHRLCPLLALAWMRHDTLVTRQNGSILLSSRGLRSSRAFRLLRGSRSIGKNAPALPCAFFPHGWHLGLLLEGLPLERFHGWSAGARLLLRFRRLSTIGP
jgi:hypothetical protein